MKYINSTFITILFFLTLSATAAPPQPQSIPPPVGTPVSINRNISFLFVSGVLLGAFYMIKKK